MKDLNARYQRNLTKKWREDARMHWNDVVAIILQQETDGLLNLKAEITGPWEQIS